MRSTQPIAGILAAQGKRRKIHTIAPFPPAMELERGVGDRIQFGDFEFDSGTGDLRRRDGVKVDRLPPQPAKLLTLLAGRRGAILTRDEIREQLWPNTHVDFDASLHFCVRQLREALGDSAVESRYVRNVPRRGYQLIADVAEVGNRPVAPRSRRRLMAALVIAVMAALAGAWLKGAWSTNGVPRVRIAIMPFEPPIAEWVLDRLSQIAGESAGIVGPTTTSAYAASDSGLRRLATDYRVDYIVNGRPVEADGNMRLLVEVIRVSDGVHVWVRRYDDLADRRRIGEDISSHIAAVLKLR
jgi:DNA-binding winged helix-turn-helix (wHTH) protein/TolB-like protein